jgi:hypothetical protein
LYIQRLNKILRIRKVCWKNNSEYSCLHHGDG